MCFSYNYTLDNFHTPTILLSLSVNWVQRREEEGKEKGDLIFSK